MLMINEQPVVFRQGCRLVEFTAEIMAGADVFIVNGFPVAPDTLLHDGDNCWLIRRGQVPSHEEMEHLLYARHTPGVQAKVKSAYVGIMGIGGLGSMVAVAMARIGVGRMLLADYDVVEPSNLNRQQYFIDQVGMKKTEAMKEILTRVNPYLTIELYDGELTEDSIPEVFKGVDVLVECFDGPEMKAAGLRAALTGLKDKGYVGASGIAGYADNNMIRTQKIYEKVYIVGDRESAAALGQGLMAPRVGIAAHHQANQVLRILLGEL